MNQKEMSRRQFVASAAAVAAISSFPVADAVAAIGGTTGSVAIASGSHR